LISCSAYRSSGEPPFTLLVAYMLLTVSYAGAQRNKMMEVSPRH
jgi:hypothetical protein